MLSYQHVPYSGFLSDSWSLGVVLYTLLIGRYPFHHQVLSNMFAKITRGKFQIPNVYGISLDAKILLRSLIRLNPTERLLSRDILKSNWFRPTEEDTFFRNALGSNRLRRDNGPSVFGADSRLYFANLLSSLAQCDIDISVSSSSAAASIASENSFNFNNQISKQKHSLDSEKIF